MSVDFETKKYIWNRLYPFIKNPYGTAGLIGNLYAESGLKPDNLQNSSEKLLSFSDESYTDAVDKNKYQRFDEDGAGYGLVQWTYKTRKQNLLAYARFRGTSIGDLDMQLDFICLELQNYSGVLSVLRRAASIAEASDVVYMSYEKPASVKYNLGEKRRKYSEEFFAQLNGNPEQPEIDPAEDYAVLKTGSKGQAVINLQNSLMKLGYELPEYGADGSYGRETAKAISAFQNDFGLVADGKAGAVTQAMISEKLAREKHFANDLEQQVAQRYVVTVSHLDAETANRLFREYEAYPVTMEEE